MEGLSRFSSLGIVAAAGKAHERRNRRVWTSASRDPDSDRTLDSYSRPRAMSRLRSFRATDLFKFNNM